MKKLLATLLLASSCYPALPYGGTCAEIKLGQKASELSDGGVVPWKTDDTPYSFGNVVKGQKCRCDEASGCKDCSYLNLTDKYFRTPCGGAAGAISPGTLFHCGVYLNANNEVTGVYASCESFN